MAMIVNVLAKCVVRDDPDNQETWLGSFSARPEVGDIVCSQNVVELPITAIKHSAVTKSRDGEAWEYHTLTVVLG